MATLHFTKKELAAAHRIYDDYKRLIKILCERKEPFATNLSVWGCVSLVDQTIMSELINEMFDKGGAK